MATRRRATIPGRRAVLAMAALVAFGGAVALVGAGSVGPDRGGGSSTADSVVTAIAVLVGLGALVFAAYVARRTSRPPPAIEEAGEGEDLPRIVLPMWFFAPLLATLFVLLFFLLVVGPCVSDRDSGPFPRGRHTTTTLVTSDHHARSRSAGKPNWPVVTGIVLGVAGLALALATALNRRPRRAEPDGPGLDDEIARSLADLDGLEDDPDHRRVVIRAYARMERALAGTGVGREPWESPQEFLRRALANLGAGASAARGLTDLFEQARFSTHPVDATMRADAATALRIVRDEITADAPPPRPQP